MPADAGWHHAGGCEITASVAGSRPGNVGNLGWQQSFHISSSERESVQRSSRVAGAFCRVPHQTRPIVATPQPDPYVGHGRAMLRFSPFGRFDRKAAPGHPRSDGGAGRTSRERRSAAADLSSRRTRLAKHRLSRLFHARCRSSSCRRGTGEALRHDGTGCPPGCDVR